VTLYRGCHILQSLNISPSQNLDFNDWKIKVKKTYFENKIWHIS